MLGKRPTALTARRVLAGLPALCAVVAALLWPRDAAASGTTARIDLPPQVVACLARSMAYAREVRLIAPGEAPERTHFDWLADRCGVDRAQLATAGAELVMTLSATTPDAPPAASPRMALERMRSATAAQLAPSRTAASPRLSPEAVNLAPAASLVGAIALLGLALGDRRPFAMPDAVTPPRRQPGRRRPPSWSAPRRSRGRAEPHALPVALRR